MYDESLAASIAALAGTSARHLERFTSVEDLAIQMQRSECSIESCGESCVESGALSAMSSAPEPVTVEALAEGVWGNAEGTSRRALVHIYVSYVRRKLAASQAVTVRCVRGAGYIFEHRQPTPPVGAYPSAPVVAMAGGISDDETGTA